MEKRETFTVLRPEAPEELILEKGEVLRSTNFEYTVTELIGEGSFGKVVECKKMDTLETVAVKVLKEHVEDTEYELSMLKTIGVLDPDQNNLVRFIECFQTNGHTCLAFEKLDMTLFDLVVQQNFTSVALDKIRDVAEQLLVALHGLKQVGVLHTDIKPDNVMVVGAGEMPMRVKLVDFGEAVLASKVFQGMEMQAIGYRAPEVCLGLPLTEAADVWAVGCVLAFLYVGFNLFPVHCEYQMMRRIVQILGQPSDHQLTEGEFTQYFFTQEEVDGQTTWRLMTPGEFTAMNSEPAKEERTYFKIPGSLDDLVQIRPVQDQTEWEDRVALVDLLKGLLHLDGEQRLTPRAALQHPFITQSYRDRDPLPGHSQDPQDPLGGNSLNPLGWLEPLNGLNPRSGPPEDPLSLMDPHAMLYSLGGSSEDSLSWLDSLGWPPEDPLSRPPGDPLSGLDSLSRPPKDPLSGPPEDPPSGLDPLDEPPEDRQRGLDPHAMLYSLGGSSEDPLSWLDSFGWPPEDPFSRPPEDPLNDLDPLSGPFEDPLSRQDPLDRRPEDRLRGLDSLGGSSEDPLSGLDLVDGPPEDRLRGLDPLAMLDSLGGSSEDPLSWLDSLGWPPEDPLSGPPGDPLSGLDSLSRPPKDPRSLPDPLSRPPKDPLSLLDPLSRPPKDPRSLPDPLSRPPKDPLNRLDPLSRTPKDPRSLLDPLSRPPNRLDRLGGTDPSGWLDPPGGPSWAPNSGSSQVPTSAGPFKRLRKRIRGALKRIRKTLFSCFKPQTED